MMFLIKNKVFFLTLSLVVCFILGANSVLAADKFGCCRWDEKSLLSGWEPYSGTMTLAQCKAKDQPAKGIDMLGWYENRVPKNDGDHAWCEKQAPDIDYDGCCYWEEMVSQLKAPLAPAQRYAENMKQSKCEGLKGYETGDSNGKSTVVWYQGGTSKLENGKPTCQKKKTTSGTGGINATTTGTQSSGTGGINASISGSFSGLDNPIGTYSIPELIGRVIRALLGIIGSLALIMFVAGGLMWMTSMGNEKRVAAGKSTLIWAAVGLVVVFFSYVIVKFVLETVTTP